HLPRPRQIAQAAPMLIAFRSLCHRSLQRTACQCPNQRCKHTHPEGQLEHYRSISPNTMSCVPMTATTSASRWPLVMNSSDCRCANTGARILHLYGLLLPSETM